ncbi:MAG TPA: TraR/DksA family transcriptional regulator [Burkholderiales bacterium]|nr:TraR/DksA family transcriptional regulator [Burkholderiales bacterium]
MSLTSQQTKELTNIIVHRRDELISELRDDVRKARAERFTEIAGEVPDTGDESVAALIADLDQAELGRDIGELRGLEAARERIASGDYGVCVDCSRDIAFERLRATPSAIRCIECQTLYEKTFAVPGSPSL